MLRIFVIWLYLLLTAGCSTATHKSELGWQNQIWRGPVVVTFLNSMSNPTDKEFIAQTKFDVVRDRGLRMARVQISSGWSSVMANTVVPDNIEFSELPKGTLVDVMTEYGTSIDHERHRYTRILRIVCAKDNEKCIAAEKANGRYQSVIEVTPAGDINERYGVTYLRRLTPEELKKYD